MTHHGGVWVASDDNNPIRRIAFGSRDAAEAFAAGLTAWSVFSDQDQRWRSVTGRPPTSEPGTAEHHR
jgi:hypothetical protein